MTGTLWQLTREYERLRERLAALEGELDEATEAQLEELHVSVEEKVRRIGLVRERVVEEYQVAHYWACRTADRAAELGREMDRLDRYMAHHLGKLGMAVVLPADDTHPAVQYSAKQTPGRTVVPPAAVPLLPRECLVEQEPKADLRMVRSMLDAGVQLPAGVRVVREWKLVVK